MAIEVNSDDILFLDIETAPAVSSHAEMTDQMKELWEKKAKGLKRDDETPEELFERAGLYAEFGKVVCISAGYHSGSRFRVKSVYGDDEKQLLGEFASMVSRWSSRKDPWLCGHNIREFDIPYIARRILINGMRVPDLLNNAGKKPWEVKVLDTMELWRFGDYRSYASLALLSEILGIPAPKDDIDGSMVGRVYWEDRDIERIARYCEKDVVAVARLFARITGREMVSDDDIESITAFR